MHYQFDKVDQNTTTILNEQDHKVQYQVRVTFNKKNRYKGGTTCEKMLYNSCFQKKYKRAISNFHKTEKKTRDCYKKKIPLFSDEMFQNSFHKE